MTWFHVQLLHATRCNFCTQHAAIIAGSQTCWKNIHEAKLLQPMTAFGEVTWRSTCAAVRVM